MQDISGRLLGEQIKVRAIPSTPMRAVGRVPGPVAPMIKDMGAMAGWFDTCGYVADNSRQQEVFGPVPTAEDAVARLLASLGHTIRR